MGRGKSFKKRMKIYNTVQNSGTVMNFPDQNLKIKKNGEQLKHRNIMNEILWIYSINYILYRRSAWVIFDFAMFAAWAHI